MTIRKIDTNGQLTVFLEGRLDTVTAPLLEEELCSSMDGLSSLVLDMEKLEYLSSAGLRIVLAAEKRMSKQGSMILKNVPEIIMDIFEVTGFVDILTIE